MHLPSWVRVLALLGATVTSCAFPTRSASEETLELLFWAGEGARGDPRVADVSSHCCCSGDVAVARVSQLPLPGAGGPLEPELAVELGETGEVLRRWPLPVDLIVAGVAGDRILVPLAPMLTAATDRAILISPDGAVAPTTVPPGLTTPALHVCPVIPDFGESEYLRCWEFRDLSSGQVWRLAFQGPCT